MASLPPITLESVQELALELMGFGIEDIGVDAHNKFFKFVQMLCRDAITSEQKSHLHYGVQRVEQRLGVLSTEQPTFCKVFMDSNFSEEVIKNYAQYVSVFGESSAIAYILMLAEHYRKICVLVLYFGLIDVLNKEQADKLWRE